jgi:raffinose/stachyose/melibiose transport system permease protein
MSGSKKFPWHIIVFLAPAFLIYTVFMIYPLVDSLRLGLYAPVEHISETGEKTKTEEFVGLENYQTLLTEPRWSERLFNAIKNNLIFFAIHMLIQNPIGLLLATLLSSSFIKGRAWYRTFIFIPTILSVVLVGFIWKMLLNPLWGIVDDLLKNIGLAALIQPWLGVESTALITISLMSVWQFVGIPMMLFLAALIGIPDELIEAARVDGATAFDIFWKIKFPLILPTVGTVSILTFVGNFNAFDLVYAVQGALAPPNFSTDILGTLFYRTYFGFQLELGSDTMGAAVAGIMFLIILSGVLVYLFGYQQRVQQVEM